MKKSIISLMAFVVVVVFVLCFMRRSETENVLRVGVLLPLTGSYSSEGVRGQAAMLMAADEINATTNLRYRIELVIEDDKYTSRDSLSAANKILLRGVDAFISFGTPPTQAIKDRINRDSIPLLAMDGSSGLAASSKWIFECFPQLSDVGAAAGKYAQKAFAPHEIALLSMRCSGGDDFAHGFSACVRGRVVREVYEPDARDVRAQIAKLLASKPTVFCVFGYGAGYETAMTQLLESEYAGIVLTDSNLTSILDKIGRYNAEIYFVSQNFGPASSSELCQRFVSKMTEGKKIIPTVFSAHLYEMVKMLSFVAEQSSKRKEDIRDGLNALQAYPSMFGPMSFDSEGSVHLPFSVMKYAAGHLSFVE